jgi:hypothetical protein
MQQRLVVERDSSEEDAHGKFFRMYVQIVRKPTRMKDAE